MLFKRPNQEILAIKRMPFFIIWAADRYKVKDFRMTPLQELEGFSYENFKDCFSKPSRDPITSIAKKEIPAPNLSWIKQTGMNGTKSYEWDKELWKWIRWEENGKTQGNNQCFVYYPPALMPENGSIHLLLTLKYALAIFCVKILHYS